jgi:hypothetical protein
MTIQQLSVFLENTAGTLVQVLQQLKKAQVQLLAITIADTAEYGILRIVCTEPQRACDELRKAGVAVAISDVFALQLDNQPGTAADVIELFSKGGISITYVYTFLFEGKAVLVFRTDSPEEARTIIAQNSLPYLDQEALARCN